MPHCVHEADKGLLFEELGGPRERMEVPKRYQLKAIPGTTLTLRKTVQEVTLMPEDKIK